MLDIVLDEENDHKETIRSNHYKLAKVIRDIKEQLKKNTEDIKVINFLLGDKFYKAKKAMEKLKLLKKVEILLNEDIDSVINDVKHLL